MASDLPRTQAFYTAVLGWDYTEDAPEYGGYTNALVDGATVAGLSPTMEGMEAAPHTWAVYLATEDITADAAKATAAGATPVFAPMEVGPFGHMGVWTDPTGAAFGMWQAKEHTGFQLFGEPRAPVWCDLMTTDPATARNFYTRLFGYTYQDMGDETMPYALFTVPNQDMPAGGIGGPDPHHPELPPMWSVAFQVDNVDDAAARIRDAGGAVASEPSDFEYGRMAVATGPDGELFVVMTPTENM
jgi:predicted enzyme related to lactoylglutathione lyase